MANLSAFLAQNAIKVENVKHVVSKRFLDEEWWTNPLGNLLYNINWRWSFKKSFVLNVFLYLEKGNQYTQETDYNLYLGKLACKMYCFSKFEWCWTSKQLWGNGCRCIIENYVDTWGICRLPDENSGSEWFWSKLWRIGWMKQKTNSWRRFWSKYCLLLPSQI